MINQDNKYRLNITFTLIIIGLSIILILSPTGFENPILKKNTLREKAIVININNSELQKNGIITVGTQNLEIIILSGKFKGKIINAENILLGHLRLDRVYQVKDKILSVLIIDETSKKIISARADSIYRINIEIFLFILFALFLILFAGWTGFKALLSFIFTALAMWKILIPLFLKGFPPILISFFIVVIITTTIILLIAGFTKKGIVALSGSIAGVGITTILAILFGYWLKIPGTVQEFSETIIYAGFQNLRITDIFISGIFISASGALMDIAMDISTAQKEIKITRPDISAKELVLSGFSIAKPVIGTMTTTLLFAYSGSFMFTFMLFMAKGTPMITIFNTNYIAAEILQTLVGSFGLVLVAPMTAIIGGIIFSNKNL